MERLQQEQQQLLEMEKMKRLEFERMQQENERQLQGNVFELKKYYIHVHINMLPLTVISDAELRLRQLEAEREHLDTELRAAHEKVKRAEDAQLLLEEEIVTRPLRGGERIRRTQSFIPTTKERPLSMDKIDSRSRTLQKNV